ncbi:ATP-dependent DNA ligase [Bradyrhizobium japonicum]
MHLANEVVKVFTRRGHDWTNRFRKVANDAWHVKANAAIIDGEVVVPTADGSTVQACFLSEMARRASAASPASVRAPIDVYPILAQATMLSAIKDLNS